MKIKLNEAYKTVTEFLFFAKLLLTIESLNERSISTRFS